MRIERVRVRRYRCLEDLTVEVADYMPIVGTNGSGKSSLLYALNWFFNGTAPSNDDVHCTVASTTAGVPPGEIDIEVTFADLNTEDRAVLGPYGRGLVAVFRRCWNPADGKEKLLGNSRQGPGFAAVRAPGVKADEMKRLYDEVRKACPNLPNATTKEARLVSLDEWEADPANAHLFVEVDSCDATHLYGFTGEHTLAKRIRFVLVPASTDLAAQLGSTKGASALQELIGALMADAVTAARAKWETDNADQISELGQAIAGAVRASTRAHTKRVNGLLADLVPRASVEFSSTAPAWSLKGDTTVLTDVIIDGERKDISRQGHGIQRALMMAMLQARVPNPDFVRSQLATDGLDAEEIEAQLATALEKLPALVIAIEEPEIYQHPVRARHFARVLANIARRPDTQVMLATHSPYFVLPEQFEALRRFSLSSGRTSVAATSTQHVATTSTKSIDAVEKTVQRELPRTFSEGFFADAVVLVEGDTDRAVLETLAERLGTPLDASGIAVLPVGGKPGLRIPWTILMSIGINVYLIADADYLGADRKTATPEKPNAVADAREGHRKSTDDLCSWLPRAELVTGIESFAFGGPTTVTSRWALFHDDIEHELDAWPSFIDQLKESGAILRSKDVTAYRAAASQAQLGDLPANLKTLVVTLAALTSEPGAPGRDSLGDAPTDQ